MGLRSNNRQDYYYLYIMIIIYIKRGEYLDIYNPIILRANRAVIPPGSITKFPKVQSRMLLWCTGNEGKVTANGSSFNLKKDMFLFLPWNHSITYAAYPDSSFNIAGIHLIPHIPKGTEITYNINHINTYNDQYNSMRSDSDLLGLKGLQRGSMKNGTPLKYLADYILSWFKRELDEERVVREMACQLLYEIKYNLKNVHSENRNIPLKLKNMVIFLEQNLASSIELSEIAAVGECSIPTANRLFKKYLNQSPVKWLQEKRIRVAATMLSTSTVSSAEASLSVGIEDPYYFSRLFKQIMGTTVSKYRMNNSIFYSTD